LSQKKHENSAIGPGRVEEITIDRLGAKGDGIADLMPPLYIPFAAPGDRLRVVLEGKRGDGRTGRISSILAAGTDRIEAPCRHFTACGGCALQHLSPQSIGRFKRAVVKTALRHRGIDDSCLGDTISVPDGSRRRAEFAVSKGAPLRIGLHRAGNKDIVDLEECPVVRPAIAAFLPLLRDLLAKTDLARTIQDIRITETATGMDLLFLSRKAEPPGAEVRQTLAGFAEHSDIARLSWSGPNGSEPLVQRRRPEICFGGARVALPGQYFLQPSVEGEEAIARIVCDAAGKARRVADLYAGIGSLSFPLAERAQTTAFELEADMVAAMKSAAAGRSLTAETRDLARSPLMPTELDRFDAVVFDPPRAGARQQAEYLAASAVPTVLAVSCNPTTLARDLRILIDGGYTLQSVTPIDQFKWSAEVEAVAVLGKG